MTHQRVELRVEVPSHFGGTAPNTIAATVHLPDPSRLPKRPAVLVAMPGAGYNRRYYDLDEPGYSEAAHHVERGIVVVAIDHLGVGESSIPPAESCLLTDVAAINHAAIRDILARLKDGAVGQGFPAISPSTVVGAGQSMGGFVLVTMQFHHRTFDAIAVLGASMVCTLLPHPKTGHTMRFAGDADGPKSSKALLMGTDWRFGFHWEDVPEHLVATDIASKPPTFGAVAPWGSATYPNMTDLVLPGVVAREAAGIDVPVLLAMGERDVCQDSLRELAAFQSAPDLALTIVPRMAHMHNFAGTRRQMWHRIDSFVEQARHAAEA